MIIFLLFDVTRGNQSELSNFTWLESHLYCGCKVSDPKEVSNETVVTSALLTLLPVHSWGVELQSKQL